MSNMRQMKMRRTALLDALIANRDAHRQVFEEALVGYRKAAITELGAMLDAAKSGDPFTRQVSCPMPEDHTGDYNQAIRMLEMCIDEDIEITADDFERLVMDEWGWTKEWLRSTSSYVQ